MSAFVLDAADHRADELIAESVVHAFDDNLADFYRCHGLIHSPDDAHRLVRKVSDIATCLGISW